MEQIIIEANGEYSVLDSWLSKNHVKCAMLVCGRSIEKQAINEYLLNAPKRLNVKILRFSDFQPNPFYESVVKGVKIFREEKCDSIIAVGGGSAMDVAKCIKLYSSLPGDGIDGTWLKNTIVPNNIPFLAMPTTSGTGSEATRFAVVYYKGVKQSVSDYSCIPQAVLLDSSVLKTLPQYQKKVTMCDALCHAIESYWSVNSTNESKDYSKKAIQGILTHMDGYLSNTDNGNAGMLIASNIAGKAINVTQTTAGHAMCYKITSLFNIPHGHAAILCDRILFPWMLQNFDKCVDPRGVKYLKETMDEIGIAMGCEDANTGAKKLEELFNALDLDIPVATETQYEELRTSVNPVRLKNHPCALDIDTIDVLYHEILR